MRRSPPVVTLWWTALSSFQATSVTTICSRQTHTSASAAFKNGENIRNTQQFADPRAQIQHLQFALCALRRNVKTHQRPQPRTIHVRQFAQVQDQRPFV